MIFSEENLSNTKNRAVWERAIESLSISEQKALRFGRDQFRRRRLWTIRRSQRHKSKEVRDKTVEL